MHSVYSDGASTLEDLVRSALAKNFKKIALTDHMPLPFSDTSAMKREELDGYRKEISSLQKKFEGKIEILMGLEMDYLPKYKEWTKEILNYGWDYTVGSIHFFAEEKEDTPYIVDSEPAFLLAYEEVFKSNSEAMCNAYYALVQKMVKTGWFDTVGHLDLIKKYNENNKFFNEQESWYKKIIEETLDTIQKSNMNIEINTTGLNKIVKKQYPSSWIITSCKKKKIPLELNSDAHHPNQIGQYFDKCAELL